MFDSGTDFILDVAIKPRLHKTKHAWLSLSNTNAKTPVPR